MPEKEVYIFVLDNKEFNQKADDSKKKVKGVGDEKNLSGLINGFKKMLPAIAAATAAFVAAKKALDWTFEAENLRSIEQQFELLTKQAGIQTKSLREGLMKVNDGLINQTDLLKQVNSAIVGLGDQAERLPEVLELARKVSVVTGEDMETAFMRLTEALKQGEAGALKTMGIIVNMDEAYQKLADSLGTTEVLLTDAQKRQAVFNEALIRGREQLGAVDVSVRDATDTWTRFKVTISEVKETLILAFEKAAGPAIKEFLKDLQTASQRLKQILTAKYGEGIAQTKARIQEVQIEIGNLSEEITSLAHVEQQEHNQWNTNQKARLKVAKERRDALDAELTKLKANLAEQTKAEAEADAVSVNGKQKKTRDQLAQEAAFNASMIALRKERLQAEKNSILEADEFDRLAQEQRDLFNAEMLAKREQIATNQNLTEIQREQQLALFSETIELKKHELEISLMKERMDFETAVLSRRAKMTQSYFNQFALGAKLASAKARASMMDFSRMGQEAFGSFTTAVGNAFVQVGQGGISLGDALKKALIGSIADRAQAEGMLLLASSVFPPNPLGLAAGAGLLTLSGVLRAAVGATTSLPGGAGGAAGGGTIAAAAPITAIEPLEPLAGPEEMEQKRKAVTIQIQGDYFDTQETRERLTEIIRESADATDFKILSVGGEV